MVGQPAPPVAACFRFVTDRTHTVDNVVERAQIAISTAVVDSRWTTTGRVGTSVNTLGTPGGQSGGRPPWRVVPALVTPTVPTACWPADLQGRRLSTASTPPKKTMIPYPMMMSSENVRPDAPLRKSRTLSANRRAAYRIRATCGYCRPALTAGQRADPCARQETTRVRSGRTVAREVPG